MRKKQYVRLKNRMASIISNTHRFSVYPCRIPFAGNCPSLRIRLPYSGRIAQKTGTKSSIPQLCFLYRFRLFLFFYTVYLSRMGIDFCNVHIALLLQRELFLPKSAVDKAEQKVRKHGEDGNAQQPLLQPEQEGALCGSTDAG